MKLTPQVREAMPKVIEMRAEDQRRYSDREVAEAAGCTVNMVRRIMANLPRLIAQELAL